MNQPLRQSSPYRFADGVAAAAASEVLAGLLHSPRRIAPKYFYDQKGSTLFDAITELDEYYIPRVEADIFATYHDEICAAVGKGVTLIEPGAGSCQKVKWLLPDLEPATYVPMDISGEHLQDSAAGLRQLYPGLRVRPQVCDHTMTLQLPVQIPEGPMVFFYPGSSIGNFEPAAARDFMRSLRARMPDADSGLLIGVDAKKGPDVLHAAYNDSEGVTAEFNLNVLDHLNELFDGSLERANFEHHALYNERAGRIEMHLRCTRTHTASLAGHELNFIAGEEIHTESSYKYAPDEFVALAESAGLRREQLWQDDQRWFSVLYFAAA